MEMEDDAQRSEMQASNAPDPVQPAPSWAEVSAFDPGPMAPSRKPHAAVRMPAASEHVVEEYEAPRRDYGEDVSTHGIVECLKEDLMSNHRDAGLGPRHAI